MLSCVETLLIHFLWKYSKVSQVLSKGHSLPFSILFLMLHWAFWQKWMSHWPTIHDHFLTCLDNEAQSILNHSTWISILLLHTDTIHLVWIFPHPWDYKGENKRNHILLDYLFHFFFHANKYSAQLCFILSTLMPWCDSASIILPLVIDEFTPA